jgi:transposase
VADATLKLHWRQMQRIEKLLAIEERRVIRRINILSSLHHGMSVELTAKVLHVDPKTVRNIREVFLNEGLDSALFDDERSGRPLDIDDRERSRIVAMVCEEPPKGFSRWTLDLIVEEAQNRELIEGASISRESVRMILREHGLKPWQQKMWCVGKINEEYVERMEDVLGLYEQPLDPKRPLVCLDEKPVQLLSEVREPRAMSDGKPLRPDFEYKREGTCSIFSAVEPKAGVYFNTVSQRRDGVAFTSFLQEISTHYSAAEKIVLVMDNLSTHFYSSVLKSLNESDAAQLWRRFEVHYTPKHASWLNQAEISIGMLAKQCIGKVRIGDMTALQQKVSSWTGRANANKIEIKWRFTRSKARKSFCYEVDASGKTLLPEH